MRKSVDRNALETACEALTARARAATGLEREAVVTRLSAAVLCAFMRATVDEVEQGVSVSTFIEASPDVLLNLFGHTISNAGASDAARATAAAFVVASFIQGVEASIEFHCAHGRVSPVVNAGEA